MKRLALAVLVSLFIVTPAWATFPSILGPMGSNNASGTSHSFSFTQAATSNDRLIVCINFGVAVTDTWPAGWTSLVDTTHADGISRLICRYKLSDGSEGSSITVTTNVASESSGYGWIFQGSSTTSAPESCGGTCVTASGLTCDPPSLTPSWGADDTDWIAVSQQNGESVSISYPTNYAHGTTKNCPTSFCGVSAGDRQLNVASEDPGVFTWGSNNHTVCATIAIRPGAVAAGNSGIGFGFGPGFID